MFGAGCVAPTVLMALASMPLPTELGPVGDGFWYRAFSRAGPADEPEFGKVFHGKQEKCDCEGSTGLRKAAKISEDSACVSA